ncbi:MAG: methyltransferase [Lentisphaeraceae bacterium]|nr:methyltransferase [Lentisphaeraceae bacterium]
MNSQIKKLVSLAVQRESVWSILDATLMRVAGYLNWQRVEWEKRDGGVHQKHIEEALKSISSDFTVKNGPFKGMVYPEKKAFGSAIVPKLLGSYEKELHEVIDEICSQKYSEVVDIGCAEGYYAIGLAMRMSEVNVFAYDTNVEAIGFCHKMARINNVEERVFTGSFCDGQTLCSIPFKGKALIISDCEGYEKELFTEEVVSRLGQHDFLIELHDCFDIEISSTIRQRFEKTHSIRAIRSIDDITKAHTYFYKELSDYDLATRRELLAEDREQIMEWFYMTPREK